MTDLLALIGLFSLVASCVVYLSARAERDEARRQMARAAAMRLERCARCVNALRRVTR